VLIFQPLLVAEVGVQRARYVCRPLNDVRLIATAGTGAQRERRIVA
jgi:hypothetical protein